MDQYPNSPHRIAERLLEAYRQEQLSQEQFLEALNMFESQLRAWYGQLEQINVDGDYTEGQELMLHARQALESVYEGVELMREYARTGDEETATQAMQLTRDASQLMAELIKLTEQNMTRLEDERDTQAGDIMG